MQVRSYTQSGISHRADLIAPLHLCPLPHVKLIHTGIEGGVTKAMIDDDLVSQSAFRPDNSLHHSITCGKYRSPYRGREIDSLVHFRNLINGMDAVTKTRSDQGQVAILNGLNGRDGRKHLKVVGPLDHQHVINGFGPVKMSDQGIKLAC